MNNYVIIDADKLKLRIEELERLYKGCEKPSIQGTLYNQLGIELKKFLSQSTPLIPEIEKAFDAGKDYGYDLGESNYIGCNRDTTIFDKQDYISNLKLDI